MTVHCPHCGTGYLLPEHLLGPRGARVRCPNCRRPFVVLREGEEPPPPAGVGAAPVVATTERAPAAPEPAPVVAEPAAAAAPPAQPAPDGLAEVTSGPTSAPAGGDGNAETMATEILEKLAQRLGPRVAEARARGRLLAELGPELMKAYDEFRARAGDDAPREAFRAVLRHRWGVDLL